MSERVPVNDREFVADLVERIASDAAFRQQLIDNPTSVIAQLYGPSLGTEDDVEGHMRAAGCPPNRTCFTTCTGGSGTCASTCAVTRSAY